MGRPIEEFPEAVNGRPFEPIEALGVALSTTKAGSSWDMDANQEMAKGMIEHLRKLGFELRRIAPRVTQPGDPDHPGEQLRRAAGARTARDGR